MKLLVKNTSTYHFWWHPYLISTPSVQICNWRKSQLFHILLITPLNIVSKMFLTAANCIWREPNFHIVMNVSGDLSDCHNKQFISFLSSWCWHKRLQCCQMIFLVWWPRIPTSKGGRWPRKGCGVGESRCEGQRGASDQLAPPATLIQPAHRWLGDHPDAEGL